MFLVTNGKEFYDQAGRMGPRENAFEFAALGSASRRIRNSIRRSKMRILSGTEAVTLIEGLEPKAGSTPEQLAAWQRSFEGAREELERLEARLEAVLTWTVVPVTPSEA